MGTLKSSKAENLRTTWCTIVTGLFALGVTGCDGGGQPVRRSGDGADLEPAIGFVKFEPQFGQDSGKLQLAGSATGFRLNPDSAGTDKVAVTLTYSIKTDRDAAGQQGSMSIDEEEKMSGTPITIELPVKKVTFSISEIEWDGDKVSIPEGKLSWECKQANTKLESKSYVEAAGEKGSTRYTVIPDKDSFLCPDKLKEKKDGTISPSFTVVRSSTSTGSDSFKTDRPVTTVQGGIKVGASAPNISLVESGACMDLNKPKKVDLVLVFKCTSNCGHLAAAGAETNSKFFKRLANEKKPKGQALAVQPVRLKDIPKGNFCAPPAQGAEDSQDQDEMLLAFKFEDAKLTNGKFRVVATFYGNDSKPNDDESKSASDVLIELTQQKN